MIHHVSHIRVRPKRKCRAPDIANPEPITTVLTADEIELKARLHAQAADNVTTTLRRMQERTQQAAQANPELEPFLTAYFEAAGRSLLQNTLALLDEPAAVAPPRRPRRAGTPRRRLSLARLMPLRMRKEQPDGPA